MTQRFSGKVALITGAGGRRGIGRATALRMASEGADIVLLDIAWPVEQRATDERDHWNGVASVASEVKGMGRRALALEVDVSAEDQVQAAVQKALECFGRIDYLIANAAARPGADRVPVVDLPEEEIRRVISVNLIGTFLCCKAVGKQMSERREGAVVIVSSQFGRVVPARASAYGASKFAQIGLMQAFACEMAPYNVRVNAVCPGLIDTARLDWSAAAGRSDAPAENEANRVAMAQAHQIPLDEQAPRTRSPR